MDSRRGHCGCAMSLVDVRFLCLPGRLLEDLSRSVCAAAHYDLSEEIDASNLFDANRSVCFFARNSEALVRAAGVW